MASRLASTVEQRSIIGVKSPSPHRGEREFPGDLNQRPLGFTLYKLSDRKILTTDYTDKYRIPIPTPLPFIWIGSVMVKILAEGFALRLSAEALAKVAD